MSNQNEAVEAAALIELFRSQFERLGELDRIAPSEASRVIAAISMHLKSWRPTAIDTETFQRIQPTAHECGHLRGQEDRECPCCGS